MLTCAKFHSRNLVMLQVTSTKTALHMPNEDIYIDFWYAGMMTELQPYGFPLQSSVYIFVNTCAFSNLAHVQQLFNISAENELLQF